MKCDVVVIGSGLGGLECAYILARAGMKVVVLERQSCFGGSIHSYYKGPLEYDTGFHYVGSIGEGQPLWRAFKYMGLMGLPWVRLDEDAYDIVTINGEDYPHAMGYERFAARMGECFPRERSALRQYAEMLRKSSVTQLDSLRPGSEISFIYDASMGAWNYLIDTFSDLRLVNALSGSAMKIELKRESLPLFTFAHNNGSFVESAWRLRGSGRLIVDKLVEGILAQGGEMLASEGASEILTYDNAVQGVLTQNGRRIESKLVISDLHPLLTCRLVKGKSRIGGVYKRRMEGMPNTEGMFTVSLRLKPGALKYFNYNRYIYSTDDVWSANGEKTDGVMVSCRVPEDGSGYTCQLDLLTPMQWRQCEPWKSTISGRRGDDYINMKRAKAMECVRLAETRIPGLAGMIQECHVSTPLTFRDYDFLPEGSAFGMRKDYRQPMLTFLSPKTPVKGLLLTGQSVLLYGVHGVTMTAFYTAAAVLGKDYIWNVINKV